VPKIDADLDLNELDAGIRCVLIWGGSERRGLFSQKLFSQKIEAYQIWNEATLERVYNYDESATNLM
jgi:hypothetical protein